MEWEIKIYSDNKEYGNHILFDINDLQNPTSHPQWAKNWVLI